VTTKSEIETKINHSPEFWDIREGVALKELIVQSLECN